MKRNGVLILSTGILLAAVSLLTLHLHREGIREVLSRFQQHQISYANHLSNQIEFFIQARSRGLKALASFPSFQHGNVKQQVSDIRAYGNEIDRVYVKAISVYDKSGAVIYSTDPNRVGSKAAETEFFVRARTGGLQEKTMLVPVLSDQSLLFMLATPLYRGAPNDNFVGALAFTLDMKEFLVSQLGSLDPKMDLDQVWIMDKSGTLLFQPQHPEMVSRNIYQEGSCRRCHYSFGYVEEILKRGQGTADYTIKDHPKKIAAFASMEIENVSWVIVANAPYDAVTGFVRKSQREHLLLLGIIALAFAVSSALIIRNEQVRIRAEEETMHLQEKMAERAKAEEALQLERNKLKGILNSMNDGVYIVDLNCDFVYVNPVIEREFGLVKGRRCHEYFHESPTACPWCKNKEIFAGTTIRREWNSNKTGKTYDLLETPIEGADGTPCKLEIMRDITARKRMERALRQSEKRYRMLVETMSDGLGVQDENGLWVYVNERFCEMLGYSKDEIVGRPVTDYLSDADREIYQAQMARRKKGDRESYEISWSRKDRQKVATLVSPKTLFDERGQFKGSFAVITGITERKRAEEALRESENRLRALSFQLLTAQETERKRISRELHDELGQALTVLKLRLNFVEKNLLDHQRELKQECEYGLQYIDQVIENVRRLSRDLSPSILEDFGLSAALRWLINSFAKSYKMKVILDMIDIDSLLPQDSHTVVYRTVQEALTNIGKHSQAKNVSFAIHQNDSRVLFSIEDDGIGFDVAETFTRDPAEKGLGLETMKGRAQMVRGSLNITAQEGKGTRITLSIPTKRG